MPATGGQPLPTAEVSEFAFGAAWGPDGNIIFSTSNGLQRVAATGGVPTSVGTDDVPVSGNWPQFLPDGGLLVVNDGDIVRLGLETLEVRTLRDPAEPVRQARYLPSGHLVYGSAGDIIALPFDLPALEARGVPTPVAQDLFEGARGGAVYFASADDGTLVYVDGGVQHSLVLVDRTGRSRPLAPERAAFRTPRFSPDGQRVSVVIDDDPRPADIWVYDLQGRRERFTTEFHNLSNAWTPDGSALAFGSSGRDGLGRAIYLKSFRGGDVELLLPSEFVTPYNQFPGSWSPDGRLLVFTELHPVTQDDLWLLDLSREPATVRELLVTPFSERDPRVSADGQWITYASNQTGASQVYVRPFPGEGSETTVSVDGGRDPRWAAESGELFYRSGPRMMVADVRTGDELVISEPRVLFESTSSSYDVSLDGQQFVMIETDPRGDGRRIEVVLNWTQELLERVPID